MPVAMYEFMSRDGETIERDYPMTNAPRVGAVIRVKGKQFRRIISKCQDQRSSGGVGRGIRSIDYAHEAVSLPNIRHGRDPSVKRYSEDGFPVFLNKREIREYEASHPHMKYDTGRAQTEYKR